MCVWNAFFSLPFVAFVSISFLGHKNPQTHIHCIAQTDEWVSTNNAIKAHSIAINYKQKTHTHKLVYNLI